MPDDRSVVEAGEVWTPPSQQRPPQYPAIKPGEPVPLPVADPLKQPIEKKERNVKTKVTWKGEEGNDEAKEIQWGGKTFKKGEAVEIEDEALIEKARNNQFFEVEGDEDKQKSRQQENTVAGGAQGKGPGGSTVTPPSGTPRR